MKPYRVSKINSRERKIEVRSEKFGKYAATTPTQYITIHPQMMKEKIFFARKLDNLTILECELRILDKISGFRETNGNRQNKVDYPISEVPCRFNEKYFKREFKTTGVLLLHPMLNEAKVSANDIAKLVYETFLLEFPFERRDIHFGNGKIKHNTLGFEEGANIVAIYDQSCCSLRLTNKLIENDVLVKIFITICELFNDPQYDDNDDISDETKNAVAIIQNCLEHQPTDILLGESNGVAVIKPNSVGMYDGNEVNILSVQYDKRGRLCYKIVQKLHRGSSTLVVIVEEVEKIDGKSEIGTFNEDTGEVV